MAEPDDLPVQDTEKSPAIERQQRWRPASTRRTTGVRRSSNASRATGEPASAKLGIEGTGNSELTSN